MTGSQVSRRKDVEEIRLIDKKGSLKLKIMSKALENWLELLIKNAETASPRMVGSGLYEQMVLFFVILGVLNKFDNLVGNYTL